MFNKNLNNVIARRGLTYKEIAVKVGISRGYVSLIKHGGANISMDKMNAIATALDIPVWAFMLPTPIFKILLMNKDFITPKAKLSDMEVLEMIMGHPADAINTPDQTMEKD